MVLLFTLCGLCALTGDKDLIYIIFGISVATTQYIFVGCLWKLLLVVLLSWVKLD